MRVDRREAGTRLDLFLVAGFPELSRKSAKRLIDGRKVAVNGRIAWMASRLLRAADRVEVDFGGERAEPPPPSVAILYEDDHCVAIAKPPGLPSGPTRDPQRPHAQRLSEGNMGCALTLLHRIDKDTSGVLLLGKTWPFSEALAEDFQQRAVEKFYLALVRGRPSSLFEVVSHLREGEGGRMHAVRSGGLRAESRFRRLAESEGYALVEARPRTGRTHQIRVQLAEKGHPILGDSLYGGVAEVGSVTVPRQMLHAWRLSFRHPGLGREIRVEAPIPKDFLEVARAIFRKGLPSPLAPARSRRR